MTEAIQILLILLLMANISIKITEIIIKRKKRKHKCKKKKKGSVYLIFIDENNFKTKIKGGTMIKEISSKQRHEFDVVFKNKNLNDAFVDGNVPFDLVDPNTGQPVTTTATVTSTPVNPVEGNSSRHHVVVETSDVEITNVVLARLVAKPDIDILNDKDDTTSDDVEEKTFDVLDYIFKPLSATGVGIENDGGVVDVP